MTFAAFDFSFVSYMKLLFQLQGQYCFSLRTKQWIICAFIWNYALGAVHLNPPPCYVASANRHYSLAGWRRKHLQTYVVQKLSLCRQCSQCSSSCVETLVILRAKFHVENSNFAAIAKVPIALPFKMSLIQENTVNLKSASFFIIMLLQKGLAYIHSQKKLRLHLARVSL